MSGTIGYFGGSGKTIARVSIFERGGRWRYSCRTLDGENEYGGECDDCRTERDAREWARDESPMADVTRVEDGGSDQ